MTNPNQYTVPLSPDNAAVLFIDSQSTLMLGTQSIDITLLKTNTEALAKLAAIYALPVVLTTTGGGGHGPSGDLITGITETFPDQPVIDRMDFLNAMSDSRFANAVAATGRKKVILAGITTDFCLIYPAASLIAAGYHVFVAIDASGSWTTDINNAALQRLTQMGATPTNVQSIAGELQNSASVKDLAVSKSYHPALFGWLSRYTPAPSLIGMNMKNFAPPTQVAAPAAGAGKAHA